MPYVPFSKRSGSAKDEFLDALHPGIPPWLIEAIATWMRPILVDQREGISGRYEVFNEGALMGAEVTIRRPLTPLAEGSVAKTRYRNLVDGLSTEPDLFLDLLDYLLRSVKDGRARMLGDVLTLGGSLYGVVANGDAGFRLEERVPEVQRERFESVAAEGGSSAQEHLKKAWASAYGRPPNPTSAYDSAVLAVEAACHQVLIPKDATPTLGKAIAAMESTIDSWQVHPTARWPHGGRMVLEMMKALWRNQFRHGDAGGFQEAEASDAEAALHIALTLVHLFSAGLVSRAEPKT